MAYIFFDLDGTLIDSQEGILNSIRYSLTKLNREIPSDDTLRQMIGPPLANGFADILRLPDDVIEDAVIFYRQYFAEKGLYENQVYDGITDLLQQLQVEKHHLAVATSKPELFAKEILKHFGLASYFTTVIGASIDGSFSNKSEILAKAIDLAGANRQHSVMIGDRKHDMLGAKVNQIKGIGVTWGFGSLQELEQAGADELVAKPSEIWKYIQSI